MDDNKQTKEDLQKQKIDYFWKLHVSLLDFVDLVPDSHRAIKAKLKTKILDAANEVRAELEDQKEKE
jgi:hypothetical protein